MSIKSEEQNKNVTALAEAILFMYGAEISFVKMAEILDVDENCAQEVIIKLQQIYDAREEAGMRIVVTDTKAQMVTHPDVAEMIEQITKKELEGPLTPVAMEVLAIIAYRGPISKIDVEAIRGVNCSFTLRNLLRRGLVERVSVDASKRVQFYQTTVDFLRVLGITSVEELPEFVELSTDKRIDAILYSEQHNAQSEDIV